MQINGNRRWFDSPRLPLLVAVACLLPFLNKAFHIDDPLFVWTAKHIVQHPADFYGFSLNWFNHAMRMADMSPNPPLVAYYLALGGLLLGWTEIAIHAAFIIPAAAAALGTFYLARRLCRRPTLATLAAVLTPGFLVSGTTVMSDMTMLAFWVWAVLLWVRGIQGNRALFLWLGALLIAPCTLAKYIGLALIPLLFAYSLAARRRLGWWVLPLLLPVAVVGAYEWVNYLLYGHGLLADAAAYTTKYATTQSLQGGATPIQKVLMTLTFAGGCTATVFFASPFLWSRKVWAGALMGTVAVVLGVVVLNNFVILPTRPYLANWSYLLQAGLMAATGVGILSLAAEDIYRHRNAVSLLLAFWVLGIFLFTAFLNWTVSARNVLTLIPPAAILLARKLERAEPLFAKWAPALSLVPAAALSILVAVADTSLANTARTAAAEIPASLRGRSGAIWYEGHWGFQYYIDSDTIRPIDCTDWRLLPGDAIIIPWNNTNLVPLPAELVSQLPSQFVQPVRWASTMNASVGAGFYSALWGPLPYAFGRVGPEEYFIFVLERLPEDAAAR